MSKRGSPMSRPVVIAGLCLLFGLFVVGFLGALALPQKPRDMTNLSVWTQDKTPLQ